MDFKNIFSWPPFTIIFRLKILILCTYSILSTWPKYESVTYQVFSCYYVNLWKTYKLHCQYTWKIQVNWPSLLITTFLVCSCMIEAFYALFICRLPRVGNNSVNQNKITRHIIQRRRTVQKTGRSVVLGWAQFAPPLCFEWGFTRTFPGNQDVAVKWKSEVIYVIFW